MQGIFIGLDRPKSKKQVREQVEVDATKVRLEATSVFGNEYDGPVSQAPDGEYYFVGPDPYTKRNFYGTVKVAAGKIKVS